MNFASTALLALAMSADAFAAAVVRGTALRRPRWRDALGAGLVFGAIAALAPLIGWSLGQVAARYVAAWDHWIAFGLLAALGLRMIFSPGPGSGAAGPPARDAFVVLTLTGLATSLDTLAAGVGLAFIEVDIVAVAAAFGGVTLLMVVAGVMLGRVLGAVAGRRAEVLGGLILIGVGATILFGHLRAA